MSNIMSNRNSTPEAGSVSSLRPPSSRAIGATTHGLRASADMAALTGQAAAGRIRPSSDFYGQVQTGAGQGNSDMDAQDKLAQQWIADIDQYETTLEEMAAATLDQDFKDELSAIEQWFRVLSEAERTAALYALLQQTTQVQIRFFIQVLQQMGKNHPMSGVLSPANFDKDPMSNRLSDAMSKLNVDSARNSLARPNAGPNVKRQSGLDSSTINAMFPDAAAAIATEKAKFTQQTGNPPTSARNSLVDNRNSLAAPTISAPKDDANGQNPVSPWGPNDASRPKSSSGGQAPMGQFVQPPPSAGALRSPRPQLTSNSNIQSTTLTTGEQSLADLPLLSPYGASGNWASMVNTPMVPTFNQQQTNNADMVANATAMKLAALSTVNNRFALDDVRKYRRARSNDAAGQAQNALSPGAPAIPGAIMVSEHGVPLSREQMMTLQQPQNLSFAAHRSRPNSPGIAVQNYGPALAFTSPQNNGFLSAYDDPTLLQDIPSWLRSLRLHKYTENLKDMKWTELIELDDKQLEERGVNALGARRKMLKVFEQVKEAKKEGKLG
ncbi:ddbc0fcd-6979-4a76-9d56-8a0ea5628952 [Thermothielavioides terrestris]|uniref:RNA-binding protein VTS1 n=1 Tax=Thermothielavioides terrestris TaxID=2587410 RepID=A0A446BJ74_9PEZI|nr:ddbc0fcd-6979-4a76-9d56-8a0ea5628952 [Thermothielavioides terrestris]